MATLAAVAALTRKILKWGALGFFTLIILLILVRVGINLRNKFFPPPPPPPTVAFGKLPSLKFPKSQISQNFSYSIETVTGNLPTTPLQIKVYKTIKSQPSLLSLQKAKEKVAALGFTGQETSLTTRLYQWRDPKETGRFLRLDIVSGDFDLSSNFYNDPEVLAAPNLPDPQKAKGIAQNFFVRLNLPLSAIDLEGGKVSLFSIQGNFLAPATSLSQAQIIRVDFFPKPINSFPVVFPQKDASLINVLVGSKKGNEREILEAHFFSRQISLKEFSTYPLKTSREAFEDLKNNKGYILNINNKTKTGIALKNIYLGYYLSPENQDFLQPVFVFEGNNDFLAYVPAISSSWTEESSQ